MRRRRLHVLDYGLGNIGSIANTLEHLSNSVRVINSHPDDGDFCDAFILPGVGAFPAGMTGLKERGLDLYLKLLVKRGVPGIGICLGMQLMAEWSLEGGSRVDGLGFFRGGVLKLLENDATVPNIGWVPTQTVMSLEPWQANLSGDFYYVHSFALQPGSPEDLAATSTHGTTRFCAAVYRDGLLGLQFHPEKSQQAGLRLLDSFICHHCR